MYITSDNNALADFGLDTIVNAVDGLTGGLVTNTGQDLIDKGANELGIDGNTRSAIDQGWDIGKSLFSGSGTSSGGGETQTQTTASPPIQNTVPQLSPQTMETVKTIVENTTDIPNSASGIPSAQSSTTSMPAMGFFKRIPPVGYGLVGGALAYGITKRPAISVLASIATTLVGIQIQRRI